MGTKIDLTRLRGGNRHTVKVTFTTENGDGAKTNETMRVVYRGESLAEEQERTAQPGHTIADYLAQSVVELPDVSENGEPVKPDREFFATLDTYMLTRIWQAIMDDRMGNESMSGR
jgi:hypothetical protein